MCNFSFFMSKRFQHHALNHRWRAVEVLRSPTTTELLSALKNVSPLHVYLKAYICSVRRPVGSEQCLLKGGPGCDAAPGFRPAMLTYRPKTTRGRLQRAIWSVGIVAPGWGRRAFSTTARRALAAGTRSDSISLVFTGKAYENLS